MNKWDKPITVVSVKLDMCGPTIRFYAPPSLYYGLKSKPETTMILYEGMVEVRMAFSQGTSTRFE